MKKMLVQQRRGFTIFFAMLVGGLALAVGVAIYDLTVRELDLSSTATQSQYAIYAADTGAECALYWDSKCPAGTCPAVSAPSAFATSTSFAAPSSGIICGVNADNTSQDVAAQGPPTGDLWRFPGCTANAPWCVVRSALTATTTFTVYFTPQPYCATVEVAKSNGLTVIVSHGYNTCVNGPGLRLERVLKVTY